MTQKRYTEKNLVEDFSRLTGQNHDLSRTYVMMVFELIKSKMETGQPVVISNFAKFQVTKLRPITKILGGKKVKISAQYTPSSIFSKGFRNEIHKCTAEIDQYLIESEREEEREKQLQSKSQN